MDEVELEKKKIRSSIYPHQIPYLDFNVSRAS